MKLEEMRQNAREGRPLAMSRETESKFKLAHLAIEGDPVAFAEFMGLEVNENMAAMLRAVDKAPTEFTLKIKHKVDLDISKLLIPKTYLDGV